MTTATDIIGSALRFHLNRLSPGESLDTDTAALCLDALNDIVDEMNHSPSMLWREVQVLSDVTTTGSSLVYGTTWLGIAPGAAVLGLNAILDGLEWPLEPITVQEHQYGFGSDASDPSYYAFDGYNTIHLRGPAAGHNFRIRLREAAAEFADGSTDYTLSAGVRSALSVMLAERVGEVLVGKVPPRVARDAAKARTRLRQRATRPDILNTRRPKSDAPSSDEEGAAGEVGTAERLPDTFETFMVDFNELARGDVIPLADNPVSVAAVGDMGTNLTASIWSLSNLDTIYYPEVAGVTSADMFSTFAGAGTSIRLSRPIDHPPVGPIRLFLQIPMDKTVGPDGISKTQYLYGIKLKYYLDCTVTIGEFGEAGYWVHELVQAPTGWAQSVFVRPEGLIDSPNPDGFISVSGETSNNLFMFHAPGTIEVIVDNVEIMIGTRHWVA